MSQTEVEFLRRRLQSIAEERDENLRILKGFRRRAWNAEDELARQRSTTDNVNIEPDSDGSYMAHIDGQPGIIGQGDTPLAARQNLIEALNLANRPTCTSLGHEDTLATGEAQAGDEDDDGWYPYCDECLRSLDGSYPIRRTGQPDTIPCAVCLDATTIVTAALSPAPPDQRIAADGPWCHLCIETWERARSAEPT